MIGMQPQASYPHFGLPEDTPSMKQDPLSPVSLLLARTGNLVDIIYVSGTDLVSDFTFRILMSYGNHIGAVRLTHSMMPGLCDGVRSRSISMHPTSCSSAS